MARAARGERLGPADARDPGDCRERQPLITDSLPFEADGDAPYLAATSREAIQAFGQVSCVELHTWGSLDRTCSMPTGSRSTSTPTPR
jgi:hypothetical protein